MLPYISCSYDSRLRIAMLYYASQLQWDGTGGCHCHIAHLTLPALALLFRGGGRKEDQGAVPTAVTRDRSIRVSIHQLMFHEGIKRSVLAGLVLGRLPGRMRCFNPKLTNITRSLCIIMVIHTVYINCLAGTIQIVAARTVSRRWRVATRRRWTRLASATAKGGSELPAARFH